MGCDIHLQIEIKKNGKWFWVNEFLPEGLCKSNYVPLNTDRNYNLFAILANVRNGYGFAGVKTGNGFVPICEPKGLPEDISNSLWEASEEDGLLGDHSHSWLTAKELSDYDWDRKTVLSGFVTANEYKVFKSIGHPKEWCGGVSGPNIEIVSNKDMDSLIKNGGANKNHYTEILWERSYKEAVGWDTYYDYQNLRGLISWDNDGKKIKDIRIVFGFDS